MECNLDGGCQCKNRSCPRHGNCAECVKYHAEGTEAIVYCMREKARKLYSDDKGKGE